jgi:branched-chain amino acid transport system ATP-binding protein
VRNGIVRTFQISRLFKELTVAENVEIAILQRLRFATQWWPSRARAAQVQDEVDETLGLLVAMKPRVLLLDEPAAGVPQGEGGRIMDAVASLPQDLSVLLIEHDMDLVFRFASHIIVLAAGAVLVEGSPREVAANERVKQIYFGRDDHGHAHF